MSTTNLDQQMTGVVSLINYKNLPRNAVTKGFLMLGGATDLQKGKAGWYAGDLSGILMEELSADQQKDHVQKVGGYIGKLMQEGRLKSAQPLEMEATIITSPKGKLKDGPFNETKEVIAGYFLIEANDLHEAINIARKNHVLYNEKAGLRYHLLKQ